MMTKDIKTPTCLQDRDKRYFTKYHIVSQIVELSYNRFVHISLDNIKHWHGKMAVFSSPAMLHSLIKKKKEAQNNE